MKTAGFIAVVCLAFCRPAAAAPQIRQFDPRPTVRLGEPVFWLIEVKHPIAEAYDLTVLPPTGAAMNVASTGYRRDGGRITAMYRVRIVAENLKIDGAPVAALTGLDGARIVIHSRALKVAAVSGDSLNVQDAVLPPSPPASAVILRNIAFVAIAALLAAWLVIVWRRRAMRSPRNTLIRQLSEVGARIGTPRPPDTAWVCILLRSDLLWGESVQAETVAQLRIRGRETQQHELLAAALESLETARYSGGAAEDNELLARTVKAAMEILDARPVHVKQETEANA